ncbi:MAG: spermidine/putrescine ABC transporter ATP-binding protein, partial [Clostridia bacterium]|nr:spermidine/putrescine ABC transporter ATP-binding protein [Clostridia bacterium]
DERTMITGFVKASIFMATHYEVTIRCEDNEWIAFSEDLLEDGEEVGIRVEKEAIRISQGA